MIWLTIVGWRLYVLGGHESGLRPVMDGTLGRRRGDAGGTQGGTQEQLSSLYSSILETGQGVKQGFEEKTLPPLLG